MLSPRLGNFIANVLHYLVLATIEKTTTTNKKQTLKDSRNECLENYNKMKWLKAYYRVYYDDTQNDRSSVA